MFTATIYGVVSTDSKMDVLKGGTQVLRFNVAVKGQQDVFIRVSFFGKDALLLQKSIAKGHRIVCSGDIAYKTFTKQDGSPGHSLDMTGKTFSFVEKASEAGAHTGPNGETYDEVPF